MARKNIYNFQLSEDDPFTKFSNSYYEKGLDSTVQEMFPRQSQPKEIETPNPLPLKPMEPQQNGIDNWLAEKLTNNPTLTKGLDFLVNNPVTKKITSFGAGANPLTWNKNISDFVYGEDTTASLEKAKQDNPTVSKVGEMTTSLLPFSKASQLVGKIPQLSKLGKVGQTVAREGLAGLGVGAAEGLYRGEGLEGAKDRAITYGGLGAGIGGVSATLGKYALPVLGGAFGAGISSSNPDATPKDILKGTALGLGVGSLPLAAKGVNTTRNALNFERGFDDIFGGYKPSTEGFSPTQLPKTIPSNIKIDSPLKFNAPEQPVQLKSLQSKSFKPINTDLRTAETNLNDAIEQLQNKYQTKDIQGAISDIVNDYAAPGERKINVDNNFMIDYIKKNDGIDIPKLFSDIEQSQGKKLIPSSDQSRLQYVAGAKPEGSYNTIQKMNEFMKKPKTLSEFVNQKKRLPINNATESNLRPLKESSSINSPSINNNALESNLMQNDDMKLFPMDLTTFSNGEVASNVMPSSPTINRIVSSTDKIPLKQKIGDTWNKIYTNWFDTQSGIKPFAKSTNNNAYINATNTKKIGGTVDYIFNDGLVNSKGQKISEGLKPIVTEIPKNKENEFMDYMLHRHNTSRFREGKPIFTDYNDNQSYEMVLKYEDTNPEFKQVAKRLDTFLDKFRNTWLKDSGLVADDVINDWAGKYANYIPTFRKFTELEKATAMSGARRGYVDQVAPVRTATGSSRDIINPIESIMNMVNKTVRVARRNEVGQEILKAVRQNPDDLKQYAEILPSTKAEAETLRNTIVSDTIEGGIDELDKAFFNPYMMANKYDNVVTVMEGGKPVFLKINDKRFLDAVTALGEQSDVNIPIVSKVNSLFKNLVTQKNPIFAVKNVMRDLPTSYVYGSEKNPLRFGKEYLSAAKDIALKKEPYQQYKALGGQMGSFFKPNDLAISKDVLMKKPGVIKSVGDFFENLNQATESAPRLAEFKRILENTGDVQKALYGAGEVTTNFSRSGSGKGLKYLNAWVPYFNASLQGIDRLVRAAVNNPKGFVAKGVVAATIPTAVQELWNNSIDQQGYKDLDNRTKDAYFVFAQGNGQFTKIPKSRELGVLFSSLFQRLARQARGEEESFKGFRGTIATNFAPANPIENNLLSPATLNLYANKDFAGRPIVPEYLKQGSGYLQYDEKTSEIAKEIGRITNWSPKKIDYIIRSYSGIIGQVLQPATTQGGNPLKPFSTAFTADVAYSNKATTDFYDNMNKLSTAAFDKNRTENIPSKKVTDEENKKNAFTEASKYMSFIRKDNLNSTPEQKRLSQLNTLNIAKSMNESLRKQENPKKLLPKLKPKGYK